ncbi:energy transducer TonB [Myroides odoratimimus]|uniref:energy transducer TonB n=1 Tax=Myroides odoratimimus TaxID=76832 RepID=UPI00310113F1
MFKKITSVIIFFSLLLSVYAQKPKKVEFIELPLYDQLPEWRCTLPIENNNTVTTVTDTLPSLDKVYHSRDVEQRATYLGGVKKFATDFLLKFKVPNEIEKGKKTSVIVQVIIEKDGTLTNIEVLRNTGYNTKDEVIRIIKELPKWSPALINNQPVRNVNVIPITVRRY